MSGKQDLLGAGLLTLSFKSREAQHDIVIGEGIGVATLKTALLGLGHTACMSQAAVEFIDKSVVVCKVNAGELSLEEDLHAQKAILLIDEEVLALSSTALVAKGGGEIERLTYGELGEVARLLGTLPHTFERYLGIGKGDAGAIVEFAGLGLGTQGDEGGVVLLDRLEEGSLTPKNSQARLL